MRLAISLTRCAPVDIEPLTPDTVDDHVNHCYIFYLLYSYKGLKVWEIEKYQDQEILRNANDHYLEILVDF